MGRQWVMSMIRRAYTKIFIFVMATRKVGILNALLLESSRIIYRFGLSRAIPMFCLSVPNGKGRLYLRTGTSDYNAFLHVFVIEAYRASLDPAQIPTLIIDGGAYVGYSAVYF